MRFLAKLRSSLEVGVLRAVEWGIPLLLVGWLLLYAASDYRQVRQGAQQGAAAFTYIDRTIKAQQAQTVPPVGVK